MLAESLIRQPLRYPLFIFKVVLLTLLGAVTLSAQAQTCERLSVQDRPKIGLVLGGGGARGGAHIGVLRMLEELRVPVDYIAGTSMGSIVGGLLATGMTVDELEKVLLNADWEDLFDDDTQRKDLPQRRKADDNLGLYGPKLGIGKGAELLPAGAVAGQKITFLFETLTSQRIQTKDFDQLPIPFRAVATDIVTGDMVVMSKGDLSIAMRSSMSVPVAFDPVTLGDQLLVDGGIVRNLPIDVVRQMGADIVIAVDVGTPLSKSEELGNVLSILGQLSSILITQNTNQQIETLGPDDVLISPELGEEISSADFTEIATAVPIGYAGAEMARDQLTSLSVSETAFQEWKQGVESCVSGPPQIQFVRLENETRFSDEIIRKMADIETGKTLDLEQLDEDIRQIYSLGFIRSARFRVVEEGGEHGVIIQVEEDVRGPDYIETGLDLSSSSRDGSLNFRVAYLKTDLDDKGAEFRTALQFGDDTKLLAEYYKPLDKQLKWILRPGITASRDEIRFFDQAGRAVTEFDIDEINAELAFGREFGRHVGLFTGVNKYSGNVKVSVGDPGLGKSHFDGGEWFLSGTYDRLDNRYLPSDGSFAHLQYVRSDASLGADNEFEQIRFNWLTARSWGRHTGWLGSTYNTTLDNNAPVYALFSGGGFLNMSGFERNQLTGQNFGLSLLGYRYELGRTGFLPAYAGMTLEYGNAAQDRGDIYANGIFNGSFYLGYKSPIGPLYVGLGWSEEHSGLLFLHLGTLGGGQSIGRR
jgi:NTE family protein